MFQDVNIMGTVMNLTKGKHGFHIHEVILYSLKGLSHEIFTFFLAYMDLSRPE
jgi:hypothetical protein